MGRDSGNLAGLSELQRAKAFERYEVLRPVVEDGMPLTKVAKEADVPLRTAQRWMALYERDGLPGLAPHRRGDRGHSHGLPEALERAIEGLALKKPRRSVAAVHRQAVEVARLKGWKEPSYTQVYRLVKSLEPAMVTLAHGGAKNYGQAYDLLRCREASVPNEIWQADHTLLDIWLQDDKGEPRRPWLTVVLDDHSRVVAGYHLGFAAPSAMGTALALRDAIWRKQDPRWRVCGIPEVFYTDHGSDFTSLHMEQVAADIRMRLVFSIPGEPRGRGKVERFFGSVNQLLLSGLPGYAPPEGEYPSKPFLNLSGLDEIFRSWLLDEYHHRVHGETGTVPLKRWEVGAFLPRLPDSLDQLDLLLLTVAKTRRVGRDGIRFGGFTYLAPELAGYVGEDVTIRYDPRDIAEIRVFHREGFFCRTVCHELSGTVASMEEIRRARAEQRRRLREGIRELTSLADTVLDLQRQPPLREQPLKRGQVEKPVPDKEVPGNQLKLYRHE